MGTAVRVVRAAHKIYTTALTVHGIVESVGTVVDGFQSLSDRATLLGASQILLGAAGLFPGVPGGGGRKLGAGPAAIRPAKAINAVRPTVVAETKTVGATLRAPLGKTATVQTNKAAGDAVRDQIAAREAPALTEQVFNTVGGVRRVDVLKLGDELVGIESKVGRTALDSRVRKELARDWWLLRQGQLDRVIWEFTPSATTGVGGPTGPLLQKLLKLGFEVRINL